MAVGLGEHETTNAFAALLLRIKLTINGRLFLVDRFTIRQFNLKLIDRIAHDFEQSKRTEQVPSLLDQWLHRIFSAKVKLLPWLHTQHVEQLLRESLLEFLLFLAVIFDAPVNELLTELLLIVHRIKLGINLPLVAEEVDQREERGAVTVDKVSVLNLLQFMHTREHFGEL